MQSLARLGWNSFFEDQWTSLDRDGSPARVMEEQRGSYRLAGHDGSWFAVLSGRLRHEIDSGGEVLKPCVGDWVLAHVPGAGTEGTARIEAVFERRTVFRRRANGNAMAAQVVAANVDVVFLVQSLNANFNLRRLERYLALLFESGAEPVIVLSKADLCPDPDEKVAEVRRVAPGVPVHVVCAPADEGLAALEACLSAGRTAALVGSSGVGKSTIVNRLLGEEVLAVQEIREDGRGRHTTTARHLVMLPGGALLLDTPGMRTVLLWEGEEGLSRVFGDVDLLAETCRFRDCTHETEPGCAVREAIENGTLAPDRFRSYRKLQKEILHTAMKTDVRLRMEEHQKCRRLQMAYRRRPDKRRI